MRAEGASVGIAGSGPTARAASQRLAGAGFKVEALVAPERATIRAVDGAHASDPTPAAPDAAPWDVGVAITAFSALAGVQAFVERIVRGSASGVPAPVVLDLTPMSPAAMRDLSAQARAGGAVVLGASIPVAGGRRSVIYADRDTAASVSVRGVLEALADDVVVCGGPGSSKAAALVSDLVVAVNTAVVRETHAMGASTGIDPAMLSALLLKGSGANAVMASDPEGPAPSGNADVPASAPALRQALVHAVTVAREAGHSTFLGALAIAALTSRAAGSDAPRGAVSPARPGAAAAHA